jgi:4-diphosphocytidyl-2-C-methyl-D-erythritol kinase
MARSLRISAPAKINLFLGVHEELDERRYHRVDSLMCCVDVADVVTVTEGEALSVVCTPAVDVPQEENSCWIAARALGEELGREPNVRIEVEKHVPDRAGLGGSSSDAAATIVALCALWGEDPHDPRCFAAARATGADVPFFLEGRPTFLVGGGDVVSEVLPPIEGAHLVLVKPTAHGAGITAREGYEDFDRDPVPAGDPSALIAALRERRWDLLPKLVESNFEVVAKRISPEVADLHQWLGARPGVLRAMVTGSGSCVFGLCESDAAARDAAEAAHACGKWAHAGTIIDHGPVLLAPSVADIVCPSA